MGMGMAGAEDEEGVEREESEAAAVGLEHALRGTSCVPLHLFLLAHCFRAAPQMHSHTCTPPLHSHTCTLTHSFQRRLGRAQRLVDERAACRLGSDKSAV